MQDELEKLFSNFTQLEKIIIQQSQKSLIEQQATILQFSVLSLIKEKANIPMSTVAEALHLSLSSATQLVERLVKLHFLERKSDDTDRRIIRISLTKKGEEQYLIIKKEILEHMAQVFENMPVTDRKELIRITSELILTLKKKV